MELKRENMWAYILVRFMCIFGTSYIHPDEFFQSQEVVSPLVFPGTPHAIPWEFKEGARTIVTPMAICAIPMLIGRAISDKAIYIYILPRVFLFLLSVVSDYIQYSILRRYWGEAAYETYTPLALGCWTSLVFSSHTFSNSVETLALSASFGTLLLVHNMHIRNFCLGLALAVGTFTRFTFVIYFLPLGLFLVVGNCAREAERARKKEKAVTAGALGGVMLTTIAEGALGGIAASAVFVIADSVYYGSIPAPASLAGLLDSLQDAPSALTITPLKNAIYNMNHANLAIHGIHPRITHFLVYMPMMFGPMFLIFLWKLPFLLKECLASSSVSFTSVVGVKSLCLVTIIFAVPVLSLAPHQELRFLLPVTIPFYLLLGDTRIGTTVKSLLILYHLVMTLIFGCMHQAGTVPALLKLQTMMLEAKDVDKFNIVTYHTYMTPLFLLSRPTSVPGPDYEVRDLGGGGWGDVCRQMGAMEGVCRRDELRCDYYLVAPRSIFELRGKIGVEPLHSFWPHVSFEDPPTNLEDAALVIYHLDVTTVCE